MNSETMHVDSHNTAAQCVYMQSAQPSAFYIQQLSVGTTVVAVRLPTAAQF